MDKKECGLNPLSALGIRAKVSPICLELSSYEFPTAPAPRELCLINTSLLFISTESFAFKEGLRCPSS